MSLHDYWSILRRGWLLIVAVAVLTVAAATGYALLKTPMYSSTTAVFVSAESAPTVQDLTQGNSYTQQVVRSYAQLVTRPVVLDPVIEELDLPTTASELGSRVTATAPVDTVIIEIQVSDESARTAADITDQIAISLSNAVDELTPGTGSVTVTPIEEAEVSDAPASPNIPLILIAGLLGGLVLGYGIAILRSVADTRIRSTQDLENVTDLPVLGGIFYDPETPSRPLIVRDDPRSPRAETFRALRTNLEFLDYGGRARSFVFTSALQGEGKSTTIVNLAIALADNGARVAVIDADLRRPRIAQVLGLEGAVGLSDVLIGRASIADVMQPWGGRSLDVLPAGQIPPNPSELLASPTMAGVIDSLLEDHDYVLIDAPPLLPVTDSAILSKLTGGAVLVAAAGRTHRNQVRGALDVLASVNAEALGVVMTMLPTKGAASAYNYGAYGHSYVYEAESAPEKAMEKKDRKRAFALSRER